MVGFACVSVTALGLSGCGGSSKASTNGAAKSTSGAAATTNGSAAGQSDMAAICKKLPVSDAQPLIRPPLSAAVVDDRLGGCTFLLPGNQVADSNLTVGFEVGGDAANRYQGDVTGTFSAGGSTVNTGIKDTNPLPGVGDKAVWGSTAGYPMMSALKGDVYCNVSTTDDATKLTIIGTTNSPLPDSTQAQQLQYAQLEGKLCTDLFSKVH
jgi:hypothetical protein